MEKMEEIVMKRYQQLSIDLALARKTVRDLNATYKLIPPSCPARNRFRSDLDEAMQIEKDIMHDINQLADNKVVLIMKFRP